MPNHFHPFPSQEKFLGTLSESLHQMAQPLSTIQASLELALMSPTSAAQYQEIAEDLLQHLQRAVESMQFTSWLARFHQPAADVHDVLLSAALESIIADLRRTLESEQLHLVFVRPDHEQLIRVSVTRLRQMLFYVLQAVQGCSGAGDVVQIEIQAPAGHLVLRITHAQDSDDRTADDKSSRVSVVVERALALADAIVTCAGGEFSVATSPLLIVANFPVQCDDRTGLVGSTRVTEFAGTQPVAGSR
ncbi:MAG TPA: hypothetical protein VHS34_01825 [Terriglobales bacterium]|nr:hypothetical protein [Terriglobales bacterium]